jgi:hypothetical protein
MIPVRIWWVVSVAVIVASPAWAWREGVEYSQVIEHCETLPLGEADSLVIRVLPKDGSFGAPRLAGIKGEQVLWEQPLPQPEAVNTAKLFAQCEGNLIKIRHEFPGTSNGATATYEWDGHKATLVASGASDPTSDVMMETEAGILDGSITDPWVIDKRIMYPQNFDWPAIILSAIRKADATGLQLAKNRDYGTAAARVSLMFDLTGLYATLRRPDMPEPSGDASPPAEWTKAWEAVGLSPQSFIAELNNYGYFLQAADEHDKAIAVFREVQRLMPDRAVSYLNLADSLWTVGEQDEARSQYAKYRNLAAETAVPARVNDRAN